MRTCRSGTGYHAAAEEDCIDTLPRTALLIPFPYTPLIPPHRIVTIVATHRTAQIVSHKVHCGV